MGDWDVFVPVVFNLSLGMSQGRSDGGLLPTSRVSKGVSPLHLEMMRSGEGEHPRGVPGARHSGRHGPACSCLGTGRERISHCCVTLAGGVLLGLPMSFHWEGAAGGDATVGAGRWRGDKRNLM